MINLVAFSRKPPFLRLIRQLVNVSIAATHENPARQSPDDRSHADPICCYRHLCLIERYLAAGAVGSFFKSDPEEGDFQRGSDNHDIFDAFHEHAFGGFKSD